MELLKYAEIHAAVIGIMLTILYYSIKKSDQAAEWRIFLHFQMHGILFVVMSLFVELIEKNARLIYLYPMLPRIMRIFETRREHLQHFSRSGYRKYGNRVAWIIERDPHIGRIDNTPVIGRRLPFTVSHIFPNIF